MAITETTRTAVDKVIETNVAAGVTDLEVLGGGAIPSGEVWRLTRFGGSEIGSGDGKASAVALQVADDGTTWVTVRGFGLVSACCEVDIQQDFDGDGVRKLRIVRQNTSAASKKIIAWIVGIRIT